MALVKRASVGVAVTVVCAVAITAGAANDLCLSPVMQIPFGAAKPVVASPDGSLLYYSLTRWLMIADVSDPSAPVVVGKIVLPGEILDDIALFDHHIYVANRYNGLRIVDVSDPTAPRSVGALNSTWEAFAVTVRDGFAFVSAGRDGVMIIDVNDPTSPVVVGSFPFGAVGFAGRIVLVGDWAVVADSHIGLRILDISDPTAPTELGVHPTPGPALGLDVERGVAYLGDGNDLRVIDITNPTSMHQVGILHRSNYIYDVQVDGTRAFIANYLNGLYELDVSDPSSPVVVGQYNSPELANRVAVHNDLAFLADSCGGVRVVDAGDSESLTEVAVLAGRCSSPSDVDYSRGFAFVGASDLHIIDISQAPAFADVAKLDWFVSSSGTGEVAVADGFAFVGDGTGTLGVADVSSPAAPFWLDQLSGGLGWVDGLEVDDGYLFFGSSSDLGVVDVSDPSNLIEVGSLGLSCLIHDLSVNGDHVFAACIQNWQGFLSAVDVSVPSAPSEVGLAAVPDLARGVDTAGRYAYVAAEESGLRVFDVGDPALPIEVGFLDTEGRAARLAVLEGYVYLAESHPKRIRAIDVSDPAAPVEVSAPRISASPSSVSLGGGYVFVTTSGTSLDVFRDCTSWVFVDGFESGDTSGWTVVAP